MARGDKSKYTSKQKRQEEHIEEGYKKRGVSKKEAERRAWATENAISGGVPMIMWCFTCPRARRWSSTIRAASAT